MDAELLAEGLVRPEGPAELGPVYPNGIVVEADGAVVWVESYTRRARCLRVGGAIEELADPQAIPDGSTGGGAHAVGRLWRVKVAARRLPAFRGRIR